ncbi:amidohydrolase [Sediminitomix flava]|uniref:Amidohydrolase 3 domain-containing protein n=1 Tax=Sediminitomix flava TaxID=379075 RepID=A0A315ZDH3_SEDFL|nr:amidohydrolase family protein [Sediminitomix flava]PWJ42918.1 hypothetical protein BC781_102464 [Sediminitomix flava]
MKAIKYSLAYQIILVLCALVLSACSSNDKEQVPATIFYGGEIVTMEGDMPEYVSAVVVEDDSIVFVGNKEEGLKMYPNSIEVDLKGMTMFPGFIEPHAHPVSIGALILASEIIAPHEWRMPHRTFPAVVGKENYLAALKKIVEAKEETGETVLVWGYHKSWHGDLTLKDIDLATGNIPVIIWQRSTHEIYLNSACAKKYGIKKGILKEKEQVDWENLHFWERAYQEIKGGALQPFFGDEKVYKRGMKRLTKMMLKNGLIAMSEPSFPNSKFETEYELLKAETDSANAYGMYLIAGFPEQFVMGKSNEEYKKRIESLPQYNTKHIKFLPNQYKTFADGAIYSLALQLQDGFFGCPHCHAEWIIPPKEGKELFDYWWDQDYKIHIHITGDLAFEKYLQFTEAAMERNPRENHRTTFHHIGLFSAEQAERAANLGVEASANPYYLWALADKYSEVGLGPERAQNMVAMQELVSRNIPLSLHSDFSMAPAEPLTLAWVAANRIVASGKVMNPEQRISVFEALKGVTTDAARTFEMENELGTISVGKQASFTILKENPFKTAPEKLKDIKVYGVVYKGRLIENK